MSTDTQTGPPAFKARVGGQAAKEADDASRPRYDKVNFFSLKEDGDSEVLRFIDDGDSWPFVNQHTYVPTRPKPEDYPAERTWPERNGATCRYDDAFDGYYKDCYICDEMKKSDGKRYSNGIRLWARAVVRKPVVGTEDMVVETDREEGEPAMTKSEARRAGGILKREIGKTVGYYDDQIEVDEADDKGKATGKKIKKLNIVVVNFSRKNFFSALQGYYVGHGTVCDRDYQIVRDGSGTDTNYNIIALNETPGHDLSEPDLKAKYLEGAPDINKLIQERATDEYFAFFFDVTKEQGKARGAKKDGDDEGGEKPAAAKKPASKAATPPAEAQEKPASDGDVSEDELAALSSRVRGRNGRKAPQPAQEEPDVTGAAESTSDASQDASDAQESRQGVPAGVGGMTLSE